VIWGGIPQHSGGSAALCGGGSSGGGVLSALCRTDLCGKELRQKREGIYALRRCAGAVAPLKLIRWLLSVK